jgi:hypothetical protein
MRGSPPLHLLIVLLGFALFAIPLAKLTFARPESPHASSRHEEPVIEHGKTKCRIIVRSVPKLASFSLKTAGGDPINGFPTSATSPMEADSQIAIPDTGVELLVNATWPQGTTESAITVEIEPGGRATQSQTRWSSSGQMSKVLTFKWLP